MASSIDATKPTAGAALTADVRNNFSAAKSEIEALQAAVASALVAKAGDTMTGALNWAATQTIASATTTDIGAATSNSVIVSGTKPITGLGTIAAGAERVVQFSGALTLTHNETSLILPGGASITTAAGDVAYFVSLGSGNWRCTGYQKANGQSVVASGGSPGGSTTQVQINDGGAFYGDANLVYAKATSFFQIKGVGFYPVSASQLQVITSGLGWATLDMDATRYHGGCYIGNPGGSSSYLQIYATSAGNFRDLLLRSMAYSGVLATGAAAPTIASAGTIAPTVGITFISGTTTISTITAPALITTAGGQITLIPTGLWSTNTAGNIALATTAVVSKALILTYDTTTGKWYPSY